MDWLERHQVVLNCFEETFAYLNDKGEIIIVKGIPRKVYVSQISSLQMKKAVRKRCKVFVVNIINNLQPFITTFFISKVEICLTEIFLGIPMTVIISPISFKQVNVF